MTHPSAQTVIPLYRRLAAKWSAMRGQTLVEKPWLDAFLGLMPDSGEVLDIGCGNGVPIARYVAGCGHEVTGVDAAPEMIAQFKENVPEADAIVKDMRQIALGRKFAGLIAWDSFFHLTSEDQQAMFAVFRDHALPGAALLFNGGHSFGEAIGVMDGESLYHSSLDEDEYKRLLDAHGFSIIRHVLEDKSSGGRSIWLAQYKS